MKLPLSEFLDRVLIFDDDENDAKALSDELFKIETLSEWYTPQKLEGVQFHTNRQLIFCDLHMWENTISDSAGIASAIRNLLQSSITEEFGAYGMVFWTEHDNEVEEIKKRLSIDRKNHNYNTPIFVISLSKMRYKTNGYEKLLEDLTAKIESSVAASFYVAWSQMVKNGYNNTVSSLYTRIKDYSIQDETIRPLLCSMALNYTGMPKEKIDEYQYLSEDTFKAMNDMLCADLYYSHHGNYDLYKEGFSEPSFHSFNEELSLYSFINSKLFLANGSLDLHQVMPGNVYEIVDGSTTYNIECKPKKARNILIELTPPCDFSHKKKKSRLVSGFLMECPEDVYSLRKMVKTTYSGMYFYKIWPIDIEGKACFICFDFRYLYNICDEYLLEPTKCKLLFRITHNLFADILQKFSSHAARLGENIMKPNFCEPNIEDILNNEKLLIKSLLGANIEKEPVPLNVFRKIVKDCHFNLDNDKDYLTVILNRYNLVIIGEEVKKKEQ